MNSSSNPPVVERSRELTPLKTPELRTGEWTRFGSERVLGDAVTERALSALAETTRAAARSQGYSVGWAEGQRQARQQAAADASVAAEQRQSLDAARAAEHAAAMAALATAAADLHTATTRACAAIEDQASTLAWELTRELMGHELSISGVDVVRRVLNLLPDEPMVAVRLHPDDLDAAGELTEHGVSLVADPALCRGDALVEAADHVLDLRLDAALARVREALQ
jgi:flagellar assembly protein FliH